MYIPTNIGPHQFLGVVDIHQTNYLALEKPFCMRQHMITSHEVWVKSLDRGHCVQFLSKALLIWKASIQDPHKMLGVTSLQSFLSKTYTKAMVWQSINPTLFMCQDILAGLKSRTTVTPTLT